MGWEPELSIWVAPMKNWILSASAIGSFTGLDDWSLKKQDVLATIYSFNNGGLGSTWKNIMQPQPGTSSLCWSPAVWPAFVLSKPVWLHMLYLPMTIFTYPAACNLPQPLATWLWTTHFDYQDITNQSLGLYEEGFKKVI